LNPTQPGSKRMLWSKAVDQRRRLRGASVI
jgi:hypothetical protein